MIIRKKIFTFAVLCNTNILAMRFCLVIIALLVICFAYPLEAQNKAEYDGVFYHTVERGQTVYSIAKMYDISGDEIIRLNIGSETGIRAGDKLKIPQKKSISPTDTSAYIFHTIQARETLYGVARKYNILGESILEANPGLSTSSFSAGKMIRIPVNAKPKQTAEIVEKKKGNKEVYYTIPDGETIYNIQRKFKTSENELLKLNPELAGGLRKGMTIRIPLRINENELPKDLIETPGEINALLEEKAKATPVNFMRIALLLPYDAENVKSVANNTRYTEYYEGILLAVDSLRKSGFSSELFVYDIGENSDKTRKILKDKSYELSHVNLIIGGASNEQIKLIADFAMQNKIKYIIPFTSKNDEVQNNAYIFQVNTPQKYLYDNAAFSAANRFSDYNIVFLDTNDKDEQKEFIKIFKEELKDRKITFKEATYNEEEFENKILSSLSTEKSNLIIPVSSSLEALDKIKTVLRSIIATKPEYRISLFGYPIWQTYYKNCLDDFHALDTYIYSLFYADNMESAVKSFYNKYKNWYSKSPAMLSFPKYAMLGFDTGMYFFGAMQKYGENFENSLAKIKYNSLQTGFNFERANNWGGFINTNIYLIHFNSDFSIARLDFK